MQRIPQPLRAGARPPPISSHLGQTQTPSRLPALLGRAAVGLMATRIPTLPHSRGLFLCPRAGAKLYGSQPPAVAGCALQTVGGACWAGTWTLRAGPSLR